MAGLLLMGLGEPSRAADDKPTAGDQRIVDALRDVINRGVDIFNPRDRGGLGDHNGCYRLFQGALMMARTQLDGHPNLQKEIDAGLANAERLATPGERAHALRAVIDQVRETLNPSLKKAAAPAKPPVTPAKPAVTLWDRLGGEGNVRKVVDDFVAAAAPDPKVDFFRGGKYKLDAKGVTDLKQKLVEFISSVSGGPFKYTGRDMKTAHAGMGITDAQFNALAGHLKMALEKNNANPADVTAVLSVIGSTRKDIVEAKKPADTKPEDKKPVDSKPADKKPADTKPAAATLWDRLGGKNNVKKVVDDFVAAAAMDPKVDFTRGGKYKLDAAASAHLKELLIELISDVSGGPQRYSGRDMKTVHKGMGITDAEFDATAGHLKAALKKNGASDDAISAVLKVVEGTRKDIVEPKKPDDNKDGADAKDKKDK
jgi:hemoglobin